MEKNTDSSAWYQQNGGNSAPLGEQAKQQAGQMVEQTKAAASRVADQAVQQVKSQLETGKEKATGSLQEMAQALHETSSSFRERNQDALGRYADSGAEMIEQVSGYFRERNVDQIVDDVENLARRQTGLFLGGAFAVGFILSRFFKSTSPTAYRRGEYDRGTGSGYARASGSLAPATASYTSEAGSGTTPSASSAVPESTSYPGATPAASDR